MSVFFPPLIVIKKTIVVEGSCVSLTISDASSSAPDWQFWNLKKVSFLQVSAIFIFSTMSHTQGVSQAEQLFYLIFYFYRYSQSASITKKQKTKKKQWSNIVPVDKTVLD